MKASLKNMFTLSSTSITYPRIKFISEGLWLSSALEDLQDIVNYTAVYSQPNMNNNAVEKNDRFFSLTKGDNRFLKVGRTKPAK